MDAAIRKQADSKSAARKAVVSAADHAQPDLVDMIFDYILAEFPDMADRVEFLKEATRNEFAGAMSYVPQRSQTERQKLVNEVLRLFDGRNAREIARRLQISRATVYRLIKTSGR